MQNCGAGEALCQRRSFLVRGRQVPAIYICACSQNIRPPLEQNFDERGTALEIKTLGQSFVIFLAFIKPGAVGGISVARFFTLQRIGIVRFDLFANRAEQLLHALREPVGMLDAPPLLVRSAAE